MKLQFKDIHIENFMSFDTADIQLNCGGYTLVCGKNENPSDNASSNGSGKSTIFEAINWVLCGETIRGSKEVSNLNTDNGALVSLTFVCDGSEYEVIRTKDHKPQGTNLKFFVNGEDKSGKGIRDTEKIFQEQLPEITSSLLGSVVILGQGLPQRFSNNTPSGRKEVLEKLSKSDFMLLDIKDRLKERSDTLKHNLREKEDSILKNNTNKSSLEASISQFHDELNSLASVEELSEVISSNKAELSNKQQEYEKCVEITTNYSVQCDKLNKELCDLSDNLLSDLQAVEEFYDKKLQEISDECSSLKSKQQEMLSTLNKLESISDTCPTCGQKLVGVEKPDTTVLRKELADFNAVVDGKLKEQSNIKSAYTNEKTTVTLKHDNNKQSLQHQIEEITTSYKEAVLHEKSVKEEVDEIQKLIEQEQFLLEHLNEQEKKLKLAIENTNKQIEDLDKIIVYDNNEKLDIQARINVINQMSTLVTRDFRGYLLSNVIEYIKTRAKMYCSDIFDTDKIDFKLDGNNICIEYDNKQYEQLSGGERQKVDLIVQFSIRDMLCNYLNFSSNILVLDEVMDNLDSIGCQKVVNLISKRLNDVGNIFIISHHADIPLPVDNELLVTKSSTGVSSVRYVV